MLHSHLEQLFCKVIKSLGVRTQLKEVGHLESMSFNTLVPSPPLSAS